MCNSDIHPFQKTLHTPSLCKWSTMAYSGNITWSHSSQNFPKLMQDIKARKQEILWIHSGKLTENLNNENF